MVGAAEPSGASSEAATELRRWRLVARLAEHQPAYGADLGDYARTAARLLAEELGDLGLVIVLDTASSGPVVALTHRNPARDALVARLADLAAPELAAALGPGAGEQPTIVSDLPLPLGPGTRRYDDEVGIETVAFAPLRRGGAVVGCLASVRDRGSAPHTPLDLTVLTAAADTVGLVNQAMRARDEQAEAQRRAAAAFELAPIGMAVVDAHGRFAAMNPIGCRIVGRALEDVVGRRWEDFAHPDDIAGVRRAMVDALEFRDASAAVNTSRFLRPDGSVRWAHLTSSLVPGERSGGTFHLQFIDVTEQYQAEAEADRLAALVHSSPDFVAIATLDERLVFVNTAGRELVGIPDDTDLTAYTLRDFIPFEDLATSPELETMWNAGKWEGVATLRDWRDDSAIPVLATSFLMIDLRTGQPNAIATVRRDIRERMADQLALARLAAQRQRLLAELVTAEQNERRRIAEDLHDESVQLLAAAQLRLQLLARQLGTGDATAAERSAADVTDLVVHALGALRATLLDLEPPTGPGNSLEISLGEAAQRLFAGSEVDVRIEGTLAAPTPEATIVLHRAAREALSNARRHAHASTVEVRIEDRPGAWAVVVEDDGTGMPIEPPLRRGHYGLVGMTSRVEALGGSVRISSRDGGGTAVEMVVPHRRQQGFVPAER